MILFFRRNFIPNIISWLKKFLQTFYDISNVCIDHHRRIIGINILAFLCVVHTDIELKNFTSTTWLAFVIEALFLFISFALILFISFALWHACTKANTHEEYENSLNQAKEPFNQNVHLFECEKDWICILQVVSLKFDCWSILFCGILHLNGNWRLTSEKRE